MNSSTSLLRWVSPPRFPPRCDPRSQVAVVVTCRHEGNGSIKRLRRRPDSRSFIAVIYAASEGRPDDALAVAGALVGLGFETEIIEVAGDLASIDNLPSRRPLLVFNLVDAINCDGRFAPLVTARLDALRIPYTGCGTNALIGTLSKVESKRTLARAGLPTPKWSAERMKLNCETRVIVKALWEHGSLGLDETSIMRWAEAPHALTARSLRLNTGHFAEAYIEGREFHLALLERISGLEVLPIAEILFGGLDAAAPKIFSFDAKWTPDSAAYSGTLRRFGLEQDEPELAKTLRDFGLACWSLFGFSGYARVDFRVDSLGAPFIIDVNPNPYLTPDSEDAAAAAEAGLSYQDLVGTIVESALADLRADAILSFDSDSGLQLLDRHFRCGAKRKSL